MESLLSSPTITPTAPEPIPANQHKKPGIAFVLSLVLPGLGHIYCGKLRNGLVTMGCFALTACGVLFLNSETVFWGAAIRASIVLYLFGFLDAFYVSREINAGLDPYIAGNNPRIAAVLNLLTNGFGYFYLGERTKGVILFFVLRFLAAAVNRGVQLDKAESASRAGMALLELVLLVIAVDAYRLARKQLKEAFPEHVLDSFATPVSGGLPAALPLVLGALVSLNYFGLAIIGLVTPNYDNLDRTSAVVTEVGQQKMYVNPKYHVQMNVPATWNFSNDEKAFLVQASTSDKGCSVALFPSANIPWRGLRGDAHVLASSVLAHNPGFHLQSEKPTQLGGRAAYEVSFVTKIGEVEVQQRYVVLEKGLTSYVFVETMASVLMDQCAPEIEQIQQNVAVGN